MSDLIESGLRDHLARLERQAVDNTSAPRVVAAVEARLSERPAPRLRRLAPAVATLGVLAVLGWAVAGSLGLRSRTPSGQATGSNGLIGAVPATVPPPGIPLAWVADPGSITRLVAYDWQGHAVGSLSFPPHTDPFPISFTASPDGSRLLVPAPDYRSQWLVSAQGERLAQLPVPPWVDAHNHGTYSSRFADDSTSVCQQRDSSRGPVSAADSTLVVIDAAGAEHRVGPEAPPDAPAGLSWGLVACSARSDEAVLVGSHITPPVTIQGTPYASSTQSGHMGQAVAGSSVSIRQVPPWVAMVRVVRLSTGREIARRVYAEKAVQFVGAQVTAGDVALVEAPGDGAATVRDLGNGRTYPLPVSGYATFTGTPGQLLVIADRDWRQPADTWLLDWRSGTIAAHRRITGSPSVLAAEPGGAGLLLEVTVFTDHCGAYQDLDMYDRNGTVHQLVHFSRHCS